MQFHANQLCKIGRGDVLVIGDGSAASTLLPAKLPLFEKLGARVWTVGER